MKVMLKAGLASAVLAIAASFAPVSAADLGYGRGGSIKDGYAPVAPAYAPSVAGPCYFRSDLGYSWSRAPHAEYVGNVDPTILSPSLDNGGFMEAGIGCGSGSRGFRGEMVLGVRQEKKFHGHYTDFTPPIPVDPLLQTHIKSYTMMFNGFYDFGNRGGFVPYVGAGMGWAYHRMGDVTSDMCNGCVQFGEDKLSFAWSLMAGVGYQLTERAILDVGYRYIDMGLARSGHGDNTFGAWNPRLEVDDMRAHEFKVGIRYHFGSSDCCAQAAYAPMK